MAASFSRAWWLNDQWSRYSGHAMRFLETNEIREWCAEHGVALDERERPAPDPRLRYRARDQYAEGRRSGREPAAAAACVRALGVWDECLLWVVGWGVWPSSEDWPSYYRSRGSRGERRSLQVAPGHWFGAGESEALVEFLTLAMENGWDAFLLAVRDATSNARAQVSHDEWIEVYAAEPVSLAEPIA